jgi:hypothetical protein
MKLDVRDSVIIAILVVIFLLYAMVNMIWTSGIISRVEEVERLSTYIDDSILDRVDIIDYRTKDCNC